MSTWDIRVVSPVEWPRLLTEIPQPPQELYAVGILPPTSLPLLAVVGSRKYSTYGKQVIDYLIDGLRGVEIGIISGLARGIDSLAHEGALRNHLYTLAVPGSGLNEKILYPASNRGLARRIVEAGGGLLSELPSDTRAALWTFPQRNRIMAGMCHATLLIEAAEKSGTLITARLAVDYNRELLAVPGNIFSATSRGTHQFLKLGATMITCAEDIIDVMQLKQTPASETATKSTLSLLETQVLELLATPLDKDALIRQLGVDITTANITLIQMEMAGYISVTANIYVRRR